MKYAVYLVASRMFMLISKWAFLQDCKVISADAALYCLFSESKRSRLKKESLKTTVNNLTVLIFIGSPCNTMINTMLLKTVS